MEIFREGVDEFADPGFRVRAAEPGEGRGAAGSDFLASSDGDEKVVGQLPYCVWDGGPECH